MVCPETVFLNAQIDSIRQELGFDRYSFDAVKDG